MKETPQRGGRTPCYLGTGFLRALEVSDVESRLAALEGQREQNDHNT